MLSDNQCVELELNLNTFFFSFVTLGQDQRRMLELYFCLRCMKKKPITVQKNVEYSQLRRVSLGHHTDILSSVLRTDSNLNDLRSSHRGPSLVPHWNP